MRFCHYAFAPGGELFGSAQAHFSTEWKALMALIQSAE